MEGQPLKYPIAKRNIPREIVAPSKLLAIAEIIARVPLVIHTPTIKLIHLIFELTFIFYSSFVNNCHASLDGGEVFVKRPQSFLDLSPYFFFKFHYSILDFTLS